MLHFPHAKINLGLRVVGKRPDGYHDIETVMLPIGWSDALEAVPLALSAEQGAGSGERGRTERRKDEGTEGRRDEGTEGRRDEGTERRRDIAWPVTKNDWQTLKESGILYTRTGISVPGDIGDDLVVKASRLFKAYAEAKGYSLPDIQAHLHKCIPPGSGLGGGSSDGASMLMLLAELFADALPLKKVQKEVARMATQLGSDCLFFMHNQPMQVMGRGDLIRPVDIPSIKGMHLVVVVPPIQINTAEAYRTIWPNRFSVPVIDTIHEDPGMWRAMLTNDFEAVIVRKHPTIKEIKEKLYEMGAVYASMSGTGSAVYGIFESNPGPSVFDDSEGYRVWSGVI